MVHLSAAVWCSKLSLLFSTPRNTVSLIQAELRRRNTVSLIQAELRSRNTVSLIQAELRRRNTVSLILAELRRRNTVSLIQAELRRLKAILRSIFICSLQESSTNKVLIEVFFYDSFGFFRVILIMLSHNSKMSKSCKFQIS